MTRRFSDRELIAIALEHREHLTSIGAWKQHRQERKGQLPHHGTFIARFGSWNQFKARLSLDLNGQHRSIKYSDEFLYKTLDCYGEHYTTPQNWNRFAEANGLPMHYLFLNRLGEEVLYEKVGYVRNWTTTKLKKIILNYFPDNPPTKETWDALETRTAKPSYKTIFRKFGSWENMKTEIYPGNTSVNK